MPAAAQILVQGQHGATASSGHEVTFYNNEVQGVRITTTRAIFDNGAKVYAMANVSSVSMTKTPAKRLPGIILAFVGLLVTGFHAGAGIVVLLIGVAWAVQQKDVFHVHIGSASGESDARSSTSAADITEIVRAMNEAFIRRG